MSFKDLRELFASIAEEAKLALPINGGFSKSENFLAEERVIRIIEHFDDYWFDPANIYIAFTFLKRSKYSTTNCGEEGYIKGLRTPALLKYSADLTRSNQITYVTQRFHGEKMYDLLRRSYGESEFDIIKDQTSTIKDDIGCNRIRLNRKYSFSELMSTRRETAVLFYNYMAAVFKKIDLDKQLTSGAFSGDAFEFLRNKRVQNIKAKESKYNPSRFAPSEPDYLGLELLVQLGSFCERAIGEETRDRIGMIRSVVEQKIEELSYLMRVSMSEDELVVMHDDNNKNVILGTDIESRLALCYIDFHRFDVGHEAENWYSQIIYPGQYGEMPNLAEQKRPDEQLKDNLSRRNKIKEQVESYLSISKKDSSLSEIDRKVKAYAIMLKWAIRDSGVFLVLEKEEISKGFMQYAIDLSDIINETKQGALAGLADNMSKTYKTIFSHEYLRP
jgi:hypothetical protein